MLFEARNPYDPKMHESLSYPLTAGFFQPAHTSGCTEKHSKIDLSFLLCIITFMHHPVAATYEIRGGWQRSSIYHPDVTDGLAAHPAERTLHLPERW